MVWRYVSFFTNKTKGYRFLAIAFLSTLPVAPLQLPAIAIDLFTSDTEFLWRHRLEGLIQGELDGEASAKLRDKQIFL